MSCNPDYILVPAIPSQEHLESIAMRLRHDFGILPDSTRRVLLEDARRVYEEVTGQGFFALERRD